VTAIVPKDGCESESLEAFDVFGEQRDSQNDPTETGIMIDIDGD
jgi:hypothetical protein